MTNVSSVLTEVSVQNVNKVWKVSGLARNHVGLSCGIEEASTTNKELHLRLLILIVFSLAAVLIGSTESHAQDVYNFYFQKNNGAQTPLGPLGPTPVPGQATESQAPLSPQVAPTTIQSSIKTVSESKSDFRKFDFSITRSWVGSPGVVTDRNILGTDPNDPELLDTYTYDDVFTRDAYSLVGSYRFNSFVATELGLTYSTKWQTDAPEKEGLGDGRDIDGSLGIALTPIHINIFGYELFEIGVLAGFFTQTRFEIDIDRNGKPSIAKEKVITPYLGPRLAINLTPELGVVLDGRMKPKSDGGGIASLGFKYRF